MNNTSAGYLSEIYSAIQGEGPLVGVRQIFVRFSGCDLRCVWCDTPGSLIRTKFCEVEVTQGIRIFNKINNPITVPALIMFIESLNPKIHHSISLTGGEPLIQTNFLINFLPYLKKEIRLPIYLETGGHRPSEFKQIVKHLDYISMDFKLPSSAKTGMFWDNHIEFLKISLEEDKNVWVKIVITNNTLFNELVKSVEIISSFMSSGRKVEMFIQPVTEVNGSRPPNELELLRIQSELLKIYPYIRVLPQVHKLINQR